MPDDLARDLLLKTERTALSGSYRGDHRIESAFAALVPGQPRSLDDIERL